MIIKINGKDTIVDKPVDLTDLISGKGLLPDHIVIEYNFRIVPKEEWAGIRLKENDNIEIISFVGGG